VALKNRPAIAVNLKIIGIADAATGNAARAVVLFAGAAAIEETTSATWQRHWVDAYHRAVAAARESLGPRFSGLQAFGRALAEAEVVKIALLAASAVPLPVAAAGQAGRRGGGMLTPREDQVSELITEGLTNQEIAVRLGISTRTADAHAEHIMTKLGVRSRAQVAAWVERGRPLPAGAAAAAGRTRSARYPIEELTTTGWVSWPFTLSKMPGAFWNAALGLSCSVEESIRRVPPSALTTKKMAPPPSRAVLPRMTVPLMLRLYWLPSV
jgi:DNA-binding CsgD family transcriptional regulator